MSFLTKNAQKITDIMVKLHIKTGYYVEMTFDKTSIQRYSIIADGEMKKAGERYS